MKPLKIFSLIIFISISCSHVLGQTLSNTLPMYGEAPKTEEYKKIDDRFIQEAIRLEGTKENAALKYIQRGWAYFYHDSLDISMKRFNQAWLLDPENPDIYFGFAALTEIKGNEVDANRYYKLAIAKDIDHTRAIICYQKIADCEEQTGNNKWAMNAYENIININADATFAYKKLGYFNSEAGNTDRAFFCYNKAINLDPKDATTYNNRGFLYQKTNNKVKAIEDYTKAIKVDPKYISAYVSRGAVELEGGDAKSAKKDFETSISLAPESGELRRMLATSKLLLKDMTGACSDLAIASNLGDTIAISMSKNICQK